MNFTWNYPIYLIRHEGGYASVAVDSSGDEARFAVAVFTSVSGAEAFMAAAEFQGEPQALGSDREFAQFLAALRPPFTEVAFDSAPEGPNVNARWTAGVADLLEKHLAGKLDLSPFSYPVYVLDQDQGYASIEGGDEQMVAIALFTDRDLAEKYRSGAGINASLHALDAPDQLTDLLRSLSEAVTAVALNPTADGGQRHAKTCVPVATLLEKYLGGA